MMKFKLINNEVTDEREKALGNKVAAECYYIMIAGTLVCLVYGSLFNNGVISAAISFLRTLIFQTSSVLILPLILSVDGLWGANVAAEIFAFVISLAFLVANRKKYHY